MDIKRLSDGDRGVDVRGYVIEVDEVREINKMGRMLRVREVILKDLTAFITLTLWNDDIEKVKEGDALVVHNGYVTEWKGIKRLNVGRYGVLEIVKRKKIVQTVDR